MDEGERKIREMYRRQVAPQVAMRRRQIERERNEGMVSYTTFGTRNSVSKVTPQQHAQQVLAHIERTLRSHSSRADGVTAARKSLPYSDVKAAHDYLTGADGDDRMASRAVNLRMVMRAHEVAGTAKIDGKSNIGGGPGKSAQQPQRPTPIRAPGKMWIPVHAPDRQAGKPPPISDDMRVDSVARAQAKRVGGSVQVGPRGGRFIMSPSGKKYYVRMMAGKVHVQEV